MRTIQWFVLMMFMVDLCHGLNVNPSIFTIVLAIIVLIISAFNEIKKDEG